MDLTDQKPTLKSGEEPLVMGNSPVNVSLIDYWRGSNSDLLSNAARGIFAEFLVATALGIPIEKPREEWATYDLITADGIKVEVKSAAYLQSWNQTKLSEIKFGIGKTKKFDLNGKMINEPAQRWADVYVFCLLAHQDKRTVNPLDVSQWEFYVVATERLNELCFERHSISLKPLRVISYTPVIYNYLFDEVKKKYKRI
ncbi:MAG: hypothetical protein ACYDH2_00510 [Anaerolineaceae bacterium]